MRWVLVSVRLANAGARRLFRDGGETKRKTHNEETKETSRFFYWLQRVASIIHEPSPARRKGELQNGEASQPTTASRNDATIEQHIGTARHSPSPSAVSPILR